MTTTVADMQAMIAACCASTIAWTARMLAAAVAPGYLLGQLL